MDTIMFAGGGLFFILLGLFLSKKHNHFILKSIKIDGRVIDVVDKVHISRGIFGQTTDKQTIKAPIVQYKYNRLYQFQAEIDARTHGLSQGSEVEVLIEPSQPKVAKLSIGARESTMIFKLMIGLGVFSCIIGAIQFRPSDYNMDFLYSPFALAVIIITIILFYIKVWPMLRLLRYTPIYHENAEEVDTQNNT